MKKMPKIGTRVVITGGDKPYLHKNLQKGSTGIVVQHYGKGVIGFYPDVWEYSEGYTSREWAFFIHDIELLPLRQRFLNFWRTK